MAFLDKLSKLIVGSDISDLEEVRRSLSRLKTLKTTTELVSFSSLVSAIQERVNSTTTKTSDKDLYTSFKDSLRELGLDVATLSVESDRLARYREYAAIVRKIPYLKRALKVLTQNILNPEDYTKDPIIVQCTDTKMSPEETGRYERQIKSLLDYLELQEFCYDIVYNTLKFGDYFVEIVILPEVLRRYNLLSESANVVENLTLTVNKKDKVNIKLEFDLSGLALLESDPHSKNSLFYKLRTKKLSQNDIYLNYLSPEYVVKLGDRFCIGYIVFKNVNASQALSGVNTTVERLSRQDAVKTVVRRIMQYIQRKSSYVQELVKTETDLRNTLARFLATYIGEETSGGNVNLQLRFVPPELMEHFTVDRSEFRPYGTSIFYGSEFLSRILIAIQTSIMIARLNRAIERRLIRVDLGASRDARRYLMEVKRLMNRRRFTVDNIGTVDEIPSSLTSFEDIYIPMKDGRSPVEFDTLAGIGDIPTRVEDMKSIRDSLVATTEVPPPYLSIEENTESKAQLTQENVVFATTVRSYQMKFSTTLTNLLHKVLTLITKDKNELDQLKNFILTFEPPVSIAMEHKSEYLQTVSSVIEILTNLGLPKEYLVKKFIPQYKTWEAEAAQIIENLEKVYKKTKEESEEAGFGGGGFGGAGGGEL